MGPRWRPALWALALSCLLLGAVAQADAGLAIRGGQISLHDEVYYLSAQIDYRLSSAAREGMHSGLPLTFELQIELERPRAWWWNKSVASLSQRYRLRYHDLTGRYILTNLNSGESSSYGHESSVVNALGRVESLPLIDRRLLSEDTLYLVRLRARLDLSSLPQPLRTLAAASRQWRLSSDWVQWWLQV